MSDRIKKLILKSNDPKLIESAFEFAKQSYKDKFRISGENYIEHGLRVALMLDKMNLDSKTIAFGILHDILDDVPASVKDIELKHIEKKFGREIATLIEKISELGKVRYSLSMGMKDKKTFTLEKIENLRRMFLALSGDLRVILVELVSRLDGLNYLHYLSKDQQTIQALETLQIFVPIANRLGLAEIRRNLEDIAFLNLFPDKYKWMRENILDRYEEGEKYLTGLIPYLKKIFKKERTQVLDINYRVKSYWSTYKKLLRKNMDFGKIHDLLALRIITSNIESCYKILGILHKNLKPISGEINDYIAKPKINGYRSLHTTVVSNEGRITEIQIRTQEMQKEAEYGVCAHWAYKEKVNLSKNRSGLEWSKTIPEFWQTFKIDFYTNKVFCFTPKGDVIVLPKGSCVIDFAYAIHSQIGNHCESGKIDGKMVQLNYVLKNADVVEISINKNKYPSKDWLKFVKTSLAKSHIKKLTDQNISFFNIPLPGFIRKKIIEISEASKKKKEEKKIQKEGLSHVYIAGQKGMLIHIAKCCNPKPGDKVMAYLAPGRATVLHKSTCGVFKEIYRKFPEKTIDASWQ